jgi:hypothetical protein
MKRILILLVAAIMMVGVAGNAMAALSETSLTLALYGGDADPDEDVSTGATALYGLGTIDTDTASTFTTTVTLDDLEVTSWSEVTAALVGSFEDYYTQVVWGTETTQTFYGALVTSDQTDVEASSAMSTNYTSGYNNVETAESVEVLSSKAASDYFTYMTTAGNYAGILYDIDHESVLDATGSAVTTLYAYNSLTETFETLGTIEFGLDATNTYLTVSYSPVPVPGAFILLGSALMGIVGIRRKNR